MKISKPKEMTRFVWFRAAEPIPAAACTLMKAVSVLSVLLSLSACQKTPTPSPVVEDAAFKKPTASEVFNLRTKCVELAEKINGEYDFDQRYLLTVHPLRQEHFSHYNPRTNRCYVELRLTADLDLMAISNRNEHAKRIVDGFLDKFAIDYIERHLYDGQTGEELAYMQKGIKAVAPTGSLKDRPGKVEWYEVSTTIDGIMADHRKE